MALFWRSKADDAPRPEPDGDPVGPLGIVGDGGLGRDGDPKDSPAQLLARQWALVQLINRNAGALPVEAVVISRSVTDRIRSVIDTARDRDLDIYAVVSINGIVEDYLPTTLRAYLALDPDLVERPNESGRTPRTALRDQLESLLSAADDLLEAAQKHDADALFTQGNFLRTKFDRSDLDL